MKKPAFSLEDGALEIAGHKVQETLPVEQAIQVGDKVIALLTVPIGSVRNDNIVCYDRAGTRLWTIEPTPHGGIKDSPYTAIRLTEDSQLLALNWNGGRYQVDPEDGTITVVGFSK